MAINRVPASCVPPDAFWQANRNFSQAVWQRGDGSTVSTRLAEHVSAATEVPIPHAKTGIHLVASTAVALLTGKVTRSPLIAAGVGVVLFKYLQRDRC